MNFKRWKHDQNTQKRIIKSYITFRKNIYFCGYFKYPRLKHVCLKVSAGISQEIAEATAKPIRFDEFNDAIDRAKSDKAPGPSGFTINM